MARQLEPTNSYSAFFSALVFALAHLHHLVAASAQRPRLISISPVWPFLWNKTILKSLIFTRVCIFYIYVLLYAYVHTCDTALGWRLKDKLWITFPLSCVSWKSNSSHQLGGKHLYMPSHPTSSLYTLSYCFETKSIYSTGWPRTQIHLPQPRIKGMHHHIKTITYF